MFGNCGHLGSVGDTGRCFKGVRSFESCLNPQDAEIFATPQMRLILSCLQLETSTPFEHPYFHKTLSTAPWMEISDIFKPTLSYEAENKAFRVLSVFRNLCKSVLNRSTKWSHRHWIFEYTERMGSNRSCWVYWGEQQFQQLYKSTGKSR